MLRNWIWPSVATRKHAIFAVDEAFWVVLAVSALNLVFAAIEAAKTGELGIASAWCIGSLFFAGMGFGIRRRSRVCAVAAFVSYITSRMLFGTPIGLGKTTISLLVALTLLHGIRGTIAYHRFAPLIADLPNIADSFRAVAAGPVGADEKSEGAQ